MARLHRTIPRTGIDRDVARCFLHEMSLIRRFEEKAAEMYALGKIGGFLHLYIGQEAVAVAPRRSASRRLCDLLLTSRGVVDHRRVQGLTRDRTTLSILFSGRPVKEDKLVYDASPHEPEQLIRSNLCWFDEARKAHAEAEVLKLHLARAKAEIVRLTRVAVRANVCPGRGQSALAG